MLKLPRLSTTSQDPRSIDKYRFVYHFLPHPERQTRATLLTHKAIFIYCLLLLAVTSVFRLLPKAFPGVLGYASNITVRALLEETNKTRAAEGKSELRLNPSLSSAAEKKAFHMFTNSYWAHIAPDGTDPWFFILSEDYDYIYAGENLAKNFSNSKQVVDAWYKSPTHRENLLSPNYDEVGFAVVDGVLDGYETTLVVQMFGRPRDRGQIATVDTQETLLNRLDAMATERNLSTAKPTNLPSIKIEPVGEIEPFLDMGIFTRSLSLIFASFIISLLMLDVWYSKKHKIPRLSGHSLLHILFLVVAIMSIWFVVRPGMVL